MDIYKILMQLDGAFAQNTLRAYRSDFNDFNTWCTSQQLTPEHITSEDIAKYIVWMTSESSSATVRRRIASLSSLYKLMDMHDPTRAAVVVIALNRHHPNACRFNSAIGRDHRLQRLYFTKCV